MKQYVIIGNGVAAAGCIEGIRKNGGEGKIIVISGEKYPVYCRPLISYYLEGKTDLNKMNYRSEDFYKNNNCEVIYGEKAEKINSTDKTVTLSNGDVITYDELCVASGSTPFIPPMKGLETVEKRFSFMTLDDTLSLEKAIDENTRVLIIGAGLIGLKCAEGIRDRVKSVTVCDLADRVLSSILDSDTAPIVQKHLEANGVELMMSDSVAELNKNTAVMKSGKEVEFDVLVTAVGVRPNTALISDIGGAVNRGIIVNDAMQTSIESIYSAGDCTEGNDISFNGKRVLALLPNAYMQGFTAGSNMAGVCTEFSKAIPMNSIGFFGLHIMTAGSYAGEDENGTVYSEINCEGAKKFFVKDNKLCGYILIGKVERGGIYTSLIREQTPLDTLDFDLLRENATFVAFSKENRGNKFGGVV